MTEEERLVQNGLMREFCLANFTDEQNKPILLTDSQAELFGMIFQKRHPRNHVMTFTRYGKSFVCALAVLARVTTFAEKWCIVAGREKQARIIMSYMIDHIFDNDYMKGKFDIGGDSEDRIRRERSKQRLTFKHPDGTFGEVFVLSADSRNKQTAGDSVMGFGAQNVVLDEAALIDDDIEAKIFRMLGDTMDNFYFKIGNPFRRNHFHKDFVNPKFHTFKVDYKLGLAEGRLNDSFLEEAAAKPLFNILYECDFPDADTIDDAGYIPLITSKDVIEDDTVSFGENIKLGIDPAGEGRDWCTWVVRDEFNCQIVGSEKISTPKTIAAKTQTIMREYDIPANQCYVDSFGVGASLLVELASAGMVVRDVNVGDKCPDMDDNEKFFNERARIYWNLRDWIKRGGRFQKHVGWKELFNIKYRAEDNRKIKIMSKDEMRRQGIASPNFADALSLTFYEPNVWGRFREVDNDKPFDPHEL